MTSEVRRHARQSPGKYKFHTQLPKNKFTFQLIRDCSCNLITSIGFSAQTDVLINV